MDARRAQEIASSPEMVNVTYNGQNVYIEHVDQSNGIATIHLVDKPDKKESISVDTLIEQ